MSSFRATTVAVVLAVIAAACGVRPAAVALPDAVTVTVGQQTTLDVTLVKP